MKIEKSAPQEKEEAAPREKPVVDMAFQQQLPLYREMFGQLEMQADAVGSAHAQELKRKIRCVKEELLVLEEMVPQQQVRKKPRVNACVNVKREMGDDDYYQC